MAEIIRFTGDLVQTSNTYKDAVAYAGKLYTVDTGPRWIKYDLATLTTDIGATATGSTPVGISIISSASSVVCLNNTTVDIFENSSGFRSNISGGTAAIALTKGQTIAGNPVSKIAFYCSNTSGTIVKVNGNTFACSTFTPAGLSGTTALSVCTLDNNWIFGTANGKLVEVDSAGAEVRVTTLPTTPNVGTAPTLRVCGLSYYNDKLLVQTNFGTQLLYTYSASSVDWKNITGACTTSTNGNTLCESSSGLVVYSNYFSQSTPSAINVADFSGDPPVVLDSLLCGDRVTDVVASGIDSTTNRGFVVYNTTAVRTFNLIPSNRVTVQTRYLDPPTVDVSYDILRLRRNKKGRATFDSLTQDITPGQSNIAASQGNDYWELGTLTDDSEYDFRTFLT